MDNAPRSVIYSSEVIVAPAELHKNNESVSQRIFTNVTENLISWQMNYKECLERKNNAPLFSDQFAASYNVHFVSCPVEVEVRQRD